LGAAKEELVGDWRKLHFVELRDLFVLPNTIRVIKPRRIRWLGHVARIGERCACKVLVEKHEKYVPFERTRPIWEGNTGMNMSNTGVDIKRPFGRLWTGLI
jgi:hypothetical protein